MTISPRSLYSLIPFFFLPRVATEEKENSNNGEGESTVMSNFDTDISRLLLRSTDPGNIIAMTRHRSDAISMNDSSYSRLGAGNLRRFF